MPATDMERAIRFYEAVFGYELSRHKMGPLDMAWFPFKEDGIGAPGSLVHHAEAYKPSMDGTLIYFTSPSGDLSNELERVEPSGGEVLLPKNMISADYGFMALIRDTEGNRVALHSRK